MIGLFPLLADLIPGTSRVAAELPERGPLGFIVLAIIVTPPLVITLISILTAPRTFRIPGLFVGSFILLVGSILASFAVAGWLLSFIVPG